MSWPEPPRWTRPSTRAARTLSARPSRRLSGTYEALVDYDVTPRDEALAIARAAAVDAAVEAGAVRDTVEIIDAEDVPLAYYPGHTNRVKVKAAGDLG
mgnify:CR=1 FL=1